MPLVYAFTFFKRNRILILCTLLLALVFAFYGRLKTPVTYSANFVIECEQIEKNTCLQVIKDIRIEELTLQATIIDVKDKVLTANTQPSKLVNVTIIAQKEDRVSTAYADTVVKRIKAHPFVKEKNAGVYKITENITPVAQRAWLKKSIGGFLLVFFAGISLTILLDLYRSTKKHL